MIMQATFFKLANIIPVEKASDYLKKAVVKAYGKKGEKVIQMNYEAIDKGFEAAVRIHVPEHWKTVGDTQEKEAEEPTFIKEI